MDGRKVCLGGRSFDTAVEAAVAFARAVGQVEAAGAGDERCRRSLGALAAHAWKAGKGASCGGSCSKRYTVSIAH